MNDGKLHRRAGALLAAAVMTFLSPQVGAIAGLPDALVMQTGGVASVEAALPLSAEVTAGGEAVLAGVDRGEDGWLNLTAKEAAGTAEVVFRLLGVLPVKTMTVTVEPPRVLVPGGQSLGVAVETQGLVVVGASDLGGETSPAQAAGIRPGDVIRSVDGTEVDSAEALSVMIARQGDEAVQVEVLREGEVLSFDVLPQIDPRDQTRRLGVWVRESTAGVGTLTYYDPQSGGFGALGHAITDVDTGILFPVADGAVYENEVVAVTRGEAGEPGELTGAFFETAHALGDIERNTQFGVFGTADEPLTDGALYPEGLPVASRGEVHTGDAQILTTIDGGEVRAYDCEIEKLADQSAPQTRSMVVRVTDSELLEQTGGIVQGMSGSPIVQDGKLVGAVTHVFVDDPTRGYGVYIEWMLDAAA